MTIGKGRLEAFSDGVIAILITIMVLDLKVPHGTSVEALKDLVPVLLSYVLSYIFVGIYWNNHHHLMHTVSRVSGSVLWANLHLLFWLSLVPFQTRWMEEEHFASLPVALYGVVLFMAGFAYYILTNRLLAIHPKDSPLARAVGGKEKEIASIIIYAIAVGLAFAYPLAAYCLYVVVAIMWLVPDRRIEKALAHEHTHS